jgi:hypothetical protein
LQTTFLPLTLPLSPRGRGEIASDNTLFECRRGIWVNLQVTEIRVLCINGKLISVWILDICFIIIL